ncbi:MAG: DNA recombination protein RmuC, partial [Muribaculaceae bacterium]|nr:DNA recombination protein RmuC [Muribaculaceae bacterium]
MLTLTLDKTKLESDLQYTKTDAERLQNEISNIKILYSDETTRRQQEYNDTINKLRQEHNEAIKILDQRYQDQLSQNQEKEEAERIRRATEEDARFKALAAEILGNTQRSFREQQELRMSEILTPLRENIEQFKRSIDEKYTREAQERFSLKEKIEELRTLNTTIGQEAKELTAALRGNSKAQGDWGEVILENILEKSGLQKGREFFIQETRGEDGRTIQDETGRGLRPDVVVKYPDGRYVVIDSKVSLTNFVSYVNADTKEERMSAGKSHVASVRKHIAELSTKNYQDYIGNGKTDFVMMFIPHESAYIAAMQLAPELWQEAYDKRVLIISPTHLISVLKLISQLWNHDNQTRNALEIAMESGRMYDKFVAFTEDLQKIEKGLSTAKEAYDKALNKLKDGNGNLIN